MAVDMVDNNNFVQAIIDKGIADGKNRNTGELGKDEFLNLLILQLKYQDPLNPVEDQQFIAQMAQFSSLEQMQNMNSSLLSVKGFSMIGKYVYGNLTNESTGINQAVEGHVESVIINGSKTFVMVDGKQVPIENIYNVADGYNPLASSLSAYTNLIGHNVFGAVYDLTTGDIVGVHGDVISLAKGTYEDYAILNNASVIVNGMTVKGASQTDRSRLISYLEGKMAQTDPANRNVELFIQDANGKVVPVTGILQSFKAEPDGTVTAVLDNLPIPVSSVSKIKKIDEAAASADDKTTGDETGKTEGVGETEDKDSAGGAENTGGKGEGAGSENAGDSGGSEVTP